MQQPTPDDLLVAALIIIVALVAFIAVLYLNRKDGKKAEADAKPAAAGGTVLVEEDGRVVRRSTRQHKPVAGDDAYPKSPVAKTPRATRSDAAASTPLTATRTPRTAERMTSPPRGRRSAAAKSPAPSRRTTKSPAPAGATPVSPKTTPRRGRPTRA